MYECKKKVMRECKSRSALSSSDVPLGQHVLSTPLFNSIVLIVISKSSKSVGCLDCFRFIVLLERERCSYLPINSLELLLYYHWWASRSVGKDWKSIT